MEPARAFSLMGDVYDPLVSDIDYQAWGDFILQGISRRGWVTGPVLDLGCGTGNSCDPMLRRGLEVTGLDSSSGMLGVARCKFPSIDFRCADLRSFKLEKSFSLAISLFDTVNNLLTDEEFLDAARCIHRHLVPGGYFVFDLNTPAFHREYARLGKNSTSIKETYYQWHPVFDERRRIAEIEMYWKNPNGEFREVHYERSYDGMETDELLHRAGFKNIEALSFPSGEPAGEDEFRIWMLAKKPEH